ncbi:MAG: GerAB/ArcD/ProY family transporter [Peptococcaceae bacterium]|nr:GerAB/ArcD/ProY family transporter [Peptococcaceae bacterium]
MSKVRVGLAQSTLALFVVTIGTVFFPVAGVVVPLAGASGWVAVLLAFFIALPWVYMATYVAGSATAPNWGQAVKAWLGPFVGRIFLMYFAFVWMWLGGLLLGQAGLVFHEMAMPRTPPIVLCFALLILVMRVGWHGLEVFVRTIEALAMFSILGLVGLLVGMLPLVRIDQLRPLIDAPPALIAHAAMFCLPWAMEGVLFALFIGVYARKRLGMGGYFAAAVGAAGFSLAFLTMMTVGVLGRGVTESYLYPTAILIQVALPGFFLEGVEMFMYPLWVVASYFKVGAAFIMVSESLAGVWQGFKQPYRTLLLGGVFMFIATRPRNIFELVASIGRVDNTFFMSFYFILPALALWVRVSRREE